MKAFVTGATGFIGRHLVAELLASGYDVWALARTFDRARSLPPAARALAGDITRPAALRAGLRGADVLFHLAVARPASRRPREGDRLERINVAGTRGLLEHAASLGVGRLVYAGCTAAVEASGAGNGAAPAAGLASYQASKARAHYQAVLPLQRQGLPLVIVELGRVFGPGDLSGTGRLLRQYTRRRLLALPGAEVAFDWTYVADAARALRLAAEHGAPGRAYRAAGPPVTNRDFFAAARAATGLPGPRLWLPVGASGGHGAASRAPEGEAALPAERLGWQPGELGPSLAATVAWHQAQLSQPAAQPPGTAE